MKKILLILLTLLYSFTVLAAPVKAADDATLWYNQGFKSWFVKVYDPNNASEIFGERYTAAQVQWIFYSIISLAFTLTGTAEFGSCAFSGDIGTCIQAVIAQAETQTPLAQAPPLPSIAQQIFADRPLSGITYTKNLFRKFHLIPEAQAQTAGFGFNALDPILPLWRGSRNIAYVLLIFVTIVMAFMIMFRVKISPQIVISVQSALPKVVTAIILITFSYAIAGFLIDLMYVVIGLVSLLLTSYTSTWWIQFDAPALFNIMTTGQPLGGINIGVLGLSVGYLFVFSIAMQTVIVTSLGLIALPLAPILGILFLIIMLVAIILLIIHIIRIVFMLLRAFANILLLTIFAPFQILAGTIIPNIGFNTWIRDFVANLSVFVVTGLLFLLSIFFLINSIIFSLQGFGAANQGGTVAFIVNIIFGAASPIGNIVRQVANPVNAVWPPLLGSGSESSIGFVFLGVSFVLFTLIPRTSEVIQGFISGRPFAFGTAIGEATGLARGVGGFVAGTVGGGVQRGVGEIVGGGIRTRWNERRGRDEGETVMEEPQGGLPPGQPPRN